jgi:hypothetical protein
MASACARSAECGFADYLNGQKSLREVILPTACRGCE